MSNFMFRLSNDETAQVFHHANRSRSQFATLKRGRNIKYCPYVFTEQGIAMLSSVLHSKRAIQVNILIMRAFVKLREILSTHKELAEKLTKLERKIEGHDVEIKAVFQAIRQLMAAEIKPKKRIGFLKDKGESCP